MLKLPQVIGVVTLNFLHLILITVLTYQLAWMRILLQTLTFQIMSHMLFLHQLKAQVENFAGFAKTLWKSSSPYYFVRIYAKEVPLATITLPLVKVMEV